MNDTFLGLGNNRQIQTFVDDSEERFFITKTSVFLMRFQDRPITKMGRLPSVTWYQRELSFLEYELLQRTLVTKRRKISYAV